jgi:hypothetical protein
MIPAIGNARSVENKRAGIERTAKASDATAARFITR